MTYPAKLESQQEIALNANTVLYIFAFLSAVVGGIAVSTGKVIPIVLFLGGGSALILIFRPVLLLWIVTFTTLIVAGTIAYQFPVLSKIWWVSYILACVLYGPALLHFLVLRNLKKQKQHSSRLIYPVLVFIGICGSSTYVNSAPLGPAVLAVKSMFMFGGVWAALSLIDFSSEIVKRWLLALLGIGLIQPIPTLYQYLFVRSARIQVGLGDIEAADSVVGTFGGSMVSGGLTAVMGLYLVILISGLFSFRRSQLISRFGLLCMLGLLAIPLMLAEVKVMFIYLPVAFALLYKDVLKNRPLQFVTGAILVLSIGATMLVAYQIIHWSARDSGSVVENSIIDNVVHQFSYSFDEEIGEEKALQGRMTRLQVLDFWWDAHDLDEPLQMLIGHGLGASRTQGLEAGYIAKQYDPLEIDRTGLAMLLWDTGLLGTLAFLLLLFSAVAQSGGFARCRHLEAWQRSLAACLQISLVLSVVSLAYRNDIPYAAPMMFILMTSFGLVDWLRKQQGNPVC